MAVAEVATRAVPSLARAFAALLGVALPAWSAAERSGDVSEDKISCSLAELRVWVERGTLALVEACRQLGATVALSAQGSDPAVTAATSDACDAAQNLLADVVRESTVFVVSPPQVLKTTNKFNCAVACLAGNALGLDESGCPMVRLAVLNEAQARDVHAAKAQASDFSVADIGPSCGQLSNDTTELTFDQTADLTSANFRGICLRSVKVRVR